MKASPVFDKDIKKLELKFSDKKQKFDASIIAGGIRCKFGNIQVLVCRPFSFKGRPFPTTFWLTCPYLIKRAGMIESLGGVKELENYMSSRNLIHEWRKYNFLHQVMRIKLMNKFHCRYTRKYHGAKFKSVIHSGTGGIKCSDNIAVKCLHLQTASFIALGRHPGSKWLREKNLCGECTEKLC